MAWSVKYDPTLLGSNTPVAPATGGLSLAGQAPSFISTVSKNPGAGQLSLVGGAVSLALGIISPPSSLSLVGYAPSVVSGGGAYTTWFGATLPALPVGVTTSNWISFSGKTVNTTYNLPTPSQTNHGAYFYPTTAAALQTALNSASQAGNGDVIVLPHATPITLSSTYLELRNNSSSGTGWVYIIPDTLDPTSGSYNPSALTPTTVNGPCTSIGPTNVSNMATLYFTNNAGYAVQSDPGAHHYRFVGINFDATGSSSKVYYGVYLTHDDTLISTLCTDITLDRCIIHGDNTYGCTHGYNMDGVRIEATACYMYNCFDYQNSSDAQAISLVNSTGPYLVDNCYLEADVECMMAGGQILNSWVMSDGQIRNCWFKRNNGSINSKNLLEFKNAQRWLVDYCHFENMYETGNQRGASINLSNIDQSGGSNTWNVVQDITIFGCNLNDCAGGITINGQAASGYPQGARYLIRHNRMYMADPSGQDNGTYLIHQVEGNAGSVIFDHNTLYIASSLTTISNYFFMSGGVSPYFVMSNNIFAGTGSFGFAGVGEPGWANAASVFLTDPACLKNAFYNDTGYPSGNYYPASIAAIDFNNLSGGDLSLSGSSPYRGLGVSGAGLPYTSSGTADGSDLGANMTLVAP